MKRTFKKLFAIFAILSFSVLPAKSSNSEIRKKLSGTFCMLLLRAFLIESSKEISNKSICEQVFKMDEIVNTLMRYLAEFDSKGIHIATGTKYNLSGFDTKGIHRDTKTFYDLQGWNMDKTKHQDPDNRYRFWDFTYYDYNEDTDTKYDLSGYGHTGFNARRDIHKNTNTKWDLQGFGYRSFDGISHHKDTNNSYNNIQGYDSRGFRFNGLYKNGTKYDERGFDHRGVHRITGTFYDPQGWNWNGKVHKDTGNEFNLEGFKRMELG